MFRRNTGSLNPAAQNGSERITSVLGPGITWSGSLRGSGGVRIEGAFDGQISIRGLVVVGETGRVTTDTLRSNTVIVAGAVRGNIIAEKLDIRSTGRVWGDVSVLSFTTEDGAFLRGQVKMEERVDLRFEDEEEDQPPKDDALSWSPQDEETGDLGDAP
jgi:cytoskeletal protein CcmA (bactofilin family)